MTSPRITSRPSKSLIGLLMGILFLSGMSGLAYEVIWLRQLNLIFGITAFALATVLAGFMGGLALGSFTFGKIADRVKGHMILFAALELGIGLYALLAPYLFTGLDQLYVMAGRTLDYGHPALNLFRTLGAFLIILIPTTLMGGTLPVISKIIVRQEKEVGLKIGLIYGINTLGATFGVFITGFFLVRAVGMAGTTYLAVAVNATVALVALLLARHLTAPAPEVQPVATGDIPGGPEHSSALRNWVLVAFAMSGFASLAYEVLWSRALVYFLGLSTYAFTTMLTAFLIGLAVGSFIISKWVDRMKDPLLGLAVVEILIGVFALALIPAINVMYPLSQSLGALLGRDSWWGVVGVRFILALILMLPATICMGATMPLVVRYYTDHIGGLGRGMGKVYAVNTLGAIFGSLAAGFLLVPLFGVRLSISLIVVLNILIAGIILTLNPVSKPPVKRVLAGICASILIGVLILADTSPLILSSVEFTGLQRRYKLLFVQESADASLAVLEDRVNGERELNIDGESTAFTIYQDMQVHKLLGHLPPLFHPDPKDFLVVGFGFGSTAYASTLYPQSQVDCVELVKDEILTAPFFEPQNHGVLDDPNLHMIIGDGRDYIKLTNKTYDVISFNAIHPKISPNLYTLGFYQQCRRLLKDDGLIVAWMPPNAVSNDEFWSLVKTFQTVFPYSSLWYVNPSHMLILGSLRPRMFDWQRLNERLADPRIKADLAETNLDNPYEILSNFVAADEKLAALAGSARLNTDDLPLVEFSQVNRTTVNVDAIRVIQRGKQNVFPYLVGIGAEQDQSIVRDSLKLYNEIKQWVVEGQVYAWLGLYTQAAAHYRRALSFQPGNANARYLLDLIARQGADLEKLVALNPRNMKAKKALADIYLEEGQFETARDLLEQAIQLDPQYAEAHHGLGVVYFQTGQIGPALRQFNNALALSPSFSAAHYYAGLAYWRMGNASQAADEFQRAVETDPSRAQTHYWLGLALEKVGKADEARAALQQALAIDPSLAQAQQALQRLSP